MNPSPTLNQNTRDTQPNTKLSTRALVILTLEKIQHGQSLASLLEPFLNQISPQDKGFAHELLLGTLRQWWALNRIGERLIENDVTDKGVLAGLNVGLYQLLYMDTPDYAAIGETVEAIKQLDKSYGAGLINAILRKVQKNPSKYAKKIEKNHSLPNWLGYDLKQDWASAYVELGQSLRLPAPIFLRVNVKFCTIDAYARLLDAAFIDYAIEPLGFQNCQTIRLIDNVKITELPHFNDGWVSVQDANAQLAANILASLDFGHQPITILDACAAPGGKTAHLLELAAQQDTPKAKTFHVKQLVALDNDKKRLNRINENLERLQLMGDNVSIIQADATTFTVKEKFDIILLDAPCTATGVLRRHPDIGILRQPDDVAQTVALQAQILENLWQQLLIGGYLLYVTCSLLKAENAYQLKAFFEQHTDVKAVAFTLTSPYKFKQAIGWQCLPLDEHGGDGFYYALLQKTAPM